MTTLLSEAAATATTSSKAKKKIMIIIQAKAAPKESFGTMDADHPALEHVLVDNEGHVVDDSGKRSHNRRQSLPSASSYRGISYGKSEVGSGSFKSAIGKRGQQGGSKQQKGGKDGMLPGVRRQLSIGLHVLSQRHTFHVPKSLFYKLPLFAERIKSLGGDGSDDGDSEGYVVFGRGEEGRGWGGEGGGGERERAEEKRGAERREDSSLLFTPPPPSPTTPQHCTPLFRAGRDARLWHLL